VPMLIAEPGLRPVVVIRATRSVLAGPEQFRQESDVRAGAFTSDGELCIQHFAISASG
jgi:hypothetical protein